MADEDPDATRRAFHDAVNMTPKQLEAWLETDESQAVGQKDGGGPDDDAEHSRWRYSPMSWGHDPLAG